MAVSDLKLRTKDYAHAIIRLFSELPTAKEGQVLGLSRVRKETGELKGIFVTIVLKTKARRKFPQS